MSENPNATVTGYDFLIRGSDYLKKRPDFKLVGRDEELKDMSSILMRKKANSIVLTGPGGVGCSALCMGLQASKDAPDATFDIVSKRFFWLDTDKLFSSGNGADINDNFKQITAILSRSWKDAPDYQPDTVLVIDDMKVFLDAVRNFGCTNLINELMSDNKKNKYQLIVGAREDAVGNVLACHSDMTEHFTLMPLEEPKGENLKAIVRYAAKNLEEFHGIKISDDAIENAIYLTNRYSTRDASLSRAQPERAVTLIDRAYSSYRQRAHTHAPELEKLEPQLAAVTAALGGKVPPELDGISHSELETRKAALEHDIDDAKKSWAAKQDAMKKIYTELRSGEVLIAKKEDEVARLRQEEAKKQAAAVAQGKANNVGDDQNTEDVFGQETPKMREIRGEIAKVQEALGKYKLQYQGMAKETDAKLELNKDHIFGEFSELSGIPVTRLTQNETEKLLNLETTLSNRVYDQDQAVHQLSDAILAAKTGLKEPTEPDAAFLFLGPSGVGKTELALALTQALYEDDKNAIRLDMSEFSEKNAVAKLIGAPPGYEGYDQGGRLTNAVRKNPRSVVLFDEIEKGDDSIYDILLQVLSAGRLTDNHGLTSDFTQTAVIMTSNIGSSYFLDPTLTFEQAKEKALADLKKKYRPEFLNRFAGGRNIICFQTLQTPTIERIAKRELGKTNDKLSSKGLKLDMSDQTIKDMVAAYYSPDNGARGISGFFKTDINPIIAKTILKTPNARGSMLATLEPGTNRMIIAPPMALVANQNALKPDPVLAFNRK